MRNILFILSKVHALLLFIILEIIAFSLISKVNTYQHVAITNTSDRFIGNVYNFTEGFHQYFGLKEANMALLEENARLRQQIKYQTFYPKGDSSLPKGDSLYRYDYITAKVINNTVYKTHNYITLNKGRKDGLKTDMGVMDPKGIVGIIVQVSDNYALVMSVLNTNSSISVKHKKSNAFGNLKWHGYDPTTLIVEDISKTAFMKKGDTIITSGYSTIFPPDFPVGIVKNVKNTAGSGFQLVEIKPTTDINRIEYVYIQQRNNKYEVDSLESKIDLEVENDR